MNKLINPNMHKIRYHYTNLPKQLLFIVLFVYALLRFGIMMEIFIFKIPEYYGKVNMPLTILMYIVIFLVLLVLFRGHKICFSTYDENTLTYYNTLLGKSRSLELSQVRLAVFDTFGVKFYDDPNADYENKNVQPLFFLPFFRDGVVEALDINAFFKMMKEREDVRVIKKFKVLPGYTKKWKALAVAYGFAAVATFMNTATPLTLFIVLLQNH